LDWWARVRSEPPCIRKRFGTRSTVGARQKTSHEGLFLRNALRAREEWGFVEEAKALAKWALSDEIRLMLVKKTSRKMGSF